MAKEGGSFDFSEQIEDINFTIDDTSKCYTIPDYNYWSSSTLINGDYRLDTNKLKKIIEGNNENWYNKLCIHGLTINWDDAQITVNGEDTSINTTPDLLKAIQDAGITVSLNSNGKLRNSEFTNKYYDLLNKINELQDELNIEYSEPEIKDALVQFDGFNSFSGESRSMTVSVGDEITLPTSATMDGDSQYGYTFTGWKNNLTNETYNPGESVIIKGDTTFIAQFESYNKSILEVYYDGSMGNVVKLDNDQDTVGTHILNGWTNEDPTETWLYFKAEPESGYNFSQWLYDGQEYTTNNLCFIQKDSGPHTLRAVFVDDSYIDDTSYTYIGYIGDEPEESEYMIDYAYYDGNDIEGEWESAKIGSTITLPNTLSRLQYYDNEVNFYGWICSTDNRTYSVGTNYTFSDNDITGDSYYPNSVGTVKFTAEYEINEYTLSFDVQGGSKSVSNIKREYNTTITLPSYDGTKDNYSFNGWIINNIRYVPGDNYTYTITKDVTAYAEWKYIGEPEIKYFDVQFNGFDRCDETNNIESPVSEGTVITLPRSATKYGDSQKRFEFDGWIKNNETDTVYSPGYEYTINENTTFTAKFIEIPIEYLVTLEVTNGKIIDGSSSKYLTYGQQATWTIEPDEGFDLPTNNTCGNCTINENIVTSDQVESSMTCTANCILDTSYTYIGDIDDPFNGHLGVDLGLPSGTKWATMNIGADSIYDYGNYYMYGMGSNVYDNSTTIYTGTEDPLDLTKDTANATWGGDWHMPTQAQMEELIANTTYTWETDYNGSGINGGLFVSKINNQSLFFPAGGFQYVNGGSELNTNTGGYYWSSTPYNGANEAYYFYFRDGNKATWAFNRNRAFCVRGVVGNL